MSEDIKHVETPEAAETRLEDTALGAAAGGLSSPVLKDTPQGSESYLDSLGSGGWHGRRYP